jgi:hypothetical protein
MPDEYTREEIRDAVWQATLGVPCDAIARGLGPPLSVKRLHDVARHG